MTGRVVTGCGGISIGNSIGGRAQWLLSSRGKMHSGKGEKGLGVGFVQAVPLRKDGSFLFHSVGRDEFLY
jgi:hypothetical protein